MRIHDTVHTLKDWYWDPQSIPNMYTHTHTHVYKRIQVHVHTHMYIYIYIHVHTHTHIHIYTHHNSALRRPHHLVWTGTEPINPIHVPPKLSVWRWPRNKVILLPFWRVFVVLFDQTVSNKCADLFFSIWGCPGLTLFLHNLPQECTEKSRSSWLP